MSKLILPPRFGDNGGPAWDSEELSWAMMQGASQQALIGGGAGGVNIADYFNTTAYTGTGAARSIVTGIDLVANPGMVMLGMNNAFTPFAVDTMRGATNYLRPGDNSPESVSASVISAFNANGVSLGSAGASNGSGTAGVLWTWRKHPKLFNVITYTGNYTARAIPHGLSVAPGMVIVKILSSGAGTFNGYIWHKGLTTGAVVQWDATAQFTDTGNDRFQATPVDSTNVYLGANGVNGGLNDVGNTYVMYVFADDPTGNIASGSYVGNGSATGPIITLPWEPQWLLVKARDGTQPWVVIDHVRGGGLSKSFAASAYQAGNDISFLSTGFQPTASSTFVNANGGNYIYLAIRRDSTEVDFWSRTDKASGYAVSNRYTRANPNNSAGIIRGVAGYSSGKRYFDALVESTNTNTCGIGIAKATQPLSDSYPGQSSGNVGICYANGGVITNGAFVTSGHGAFDASDYVGIAYDLDALKFWIARNNIWLNGDPAAGTGGASITSGTYYPAYGANGGVMTVVGNVIGKTKYTPPAGFS
jgi:hypothetical protein